MKVIAICLAAVCLAVLPAGAWADDPAPAGLKWAGAYDEVLKESQASEKPLALFFFNPIQFGSKGIEDAICKDAGVVGLGAEFLFVRIDGSKDKDAVKKLAPGKMPAVVVFDAYGKRVHQAENIHKPETVVEALTKAKELIAASMKQITWISGLDEGLKEAQRRNRPVFAYFRSAGWGACKRLEGGALSDKEFIKASKRFVCLMFDAAAKPPTDKYGVKAYPALMFLDPQGAKVRDPKWGGDAASLIEDMARVLKDYVKLPDDMAPRTSEPLITLAKTGTLNDLLGEIAGQMGLKCVIEGQLMEALKRDQTTVAFNKAPFSDVQAFFEEKYGIGLVVEGEILQVFNKR